MTKHRDDPIYQIDIEPTHESQPSGATIVYLIAFLIFGGVVALLIELGRIVAEALGR